MAQNTYLKDLRNKQSINFAVNYLGNVPIETSVNEMVKDLRTQTITSEKKCRECPRKLSPENIWPENPWTDPNQLLDKTFSEQIRECISHLAGLVGVCPQHEVNSVVGRIIGEFEVDNNLVEINISSSMVKIIKNNRITHRHPLKTLSIGTRGIDSTSTMFGYIAKNFDGNGRKCHVFDIGDIEEVDRFAECLNAAIEVMSLEVEPANPSFSRPNDGFAVPTPPKRRSHFAEVAMNLEKQLYYHGKMSREEARPLLTRPGDFLVRQSNKSPGQFILSGLTETNDLHLTLLDESHKIHTEVGSFKTVSELVDFYMSKGMPVKVLDYPSIKLIRPILRKY